MKRISIVAFALLFAGQICAQYVDLGLPSGTKWKSSNEQGHYKYEDAIRKYGNSVPSKDQWNELKEFCTWTYSDDAYKVVGKNGNLIVLPIAGFRNGYDWTFNEGYGQYWSSTPNGSEYAWDFEFWAGKVIGVDFYDKKRGCSVRLVSK